MTLCSFEGKFPVPCTPTDHVCLALDGTYDNCSFLANAPTPLGQACESKMTSATGYVKPCVRSPGRRGASPASCCHSHIDLHRQSSIAEIAASHARGLLVWITRRLHMVVCNPATLHAPSVLTHDLPPVERRLPLDRGGSRPTDGSFGARSGCVKDSL